MTRALWAVIAALFLAAAAATSPTFDNIPVVMHIAGNAYNRMLQDIFSETVNPLFYGGGSAVDRTGATNTQPAFAAAVTAACGFSPVRPLAIPPGTYSLDAPIVPPAGCDNLGLRTPFGGVTLKASAANVTAPAMLLSVANLDGFSCQGITFDGNSPTTANTNSLVQLSGGMRAPSFDGCNFVNSGGTGLVVVAGAPVFAGLMNATVLPGNTVISFASVPATIHPGAFMPGMEIDPDQYATAVSGTTVTLAKALTDTLLTGTNVKFTNAFTVSTDAFRGDTVLLTASTSGVALRQTIAGATTACITKNTRIVAIATNVSVTFDQPLQCKVAATTTVAAMLGISSLRVTNGRFENLGMNLATAGLDTFTTATSTAQGATSVTFSCVSGVQCAKVGLVPGNTTTAGVPAGMPSGNKVLDGPVISNGAGTYSVTFASPTTQIIPAGTAIPFIVAGPSGRGYGIWSAWGAAFANQDYRITGNLFRHTWSAPIYIWATEGAVLDNVYREDHTEFENPHIAPSPCVNAGANLNIILSGVCSGGTGDGLETNHNVGIMFTKLNVSLNAWQGIFACSGRNVSFVDVISTNNGQWVNYPVTQQPAPGDASAIKVSGSCTFGQPGTMTNLMMSGLTLVDDQIIPTQNYGIWQSNHNASIVNPVFGSMVFAGNKILSSDPFLGIVPVPPGTDNRLANPCAAIDQSNEGALASGNGVYGPDQWQALASPTRVTYQRVTLSMGGCTTAVKMTVSTSAAPGAAEYNILRQPIESQTLADLKYGSASPLSVVVDFCASASTAGTYGWGLQILNAGFGNRVYSSSYTITAPATPQCFSFVVPGDTVRAFPLTPTNAGLALLFDAGAGSTSQTASCNAWADSAAAFNGLFCSVGTTALTSLAIGQSISISAARLYPATVDVSWVQRTPSVEMAGLTRWFTKTFPVGVAPAQNAGGAGSLCVQNTLANSTQLYVWQFPTGMRVSPTIVTYNPAAANANWRNTTLGADSAMTVNADLSEDTTQVPLTSASVVSVNDNLCFQGTANARM